MARKTKQIQSPPLYSIGALVRNDLSSHPKRADLEKLLKQWVKHPDDNARAEFARAVNEFDGYVRASKSIPSKSQERTDLQNLVEGLSDIRKRLLHFPPRALANVHLSIWQQLQGQDVSNFLDRIQRDLALLQGGIEKSMPKENLPVGHRPRSRNSADRQHLIWRLQPILDRCGRINDAESMANDIVNALST